MQAMPGFSDKLDDEQAAALANYLRTQWGGQPGEVAQATVQALR
jgi:mono/diheme cytochrome c family protein